MKISNKIEDLNELDGFYIWGAGTHTALLMQFTDIKNYNIKGIIDTNKNYIGKKVFNIPIGHPTENIHRLYPILISSQHSQDRIEKYIEYLNLDNRIIKLY